MGIIGVLGRAFLGSVIAGMVLVKVLETFTEMGGLATDMIFRRRGRGNRHSDPGK